MHLAEFKTPECQLPQIILWEKEKEKEIRIEYERIEEIYLGRMELKFGLHTHLSIFRLQTWHISKFGPLL